MLHLPSAWDEALGGRLSEHGFTREDVPVAILPLEFSGGNLALAFVSQSGALHFVEYSTNLVDSSWLPATNFPGDGATNQIALPSTNPAAFYRVQTQ